WINLKTIWIFPVLLRVRKDGSYRCYCSVLLQVECPCGPTISKSNERNDKQRPCQIHGNTRRRNGAIDESRKGFDAWHNVQEDRCDKRELCQEQRNIAAAQVIHLAYIGRNEKGQRQVVSHDHVVVSACDAVPGDDQERCSQACDDERPLLLA